MSGTGRIALTVTRFTSTTQTADDRQNISSVLAGSAWGASAGTPAATLTYSFPASASFYGTQANYGDPSPYNGFAVLNPAQQTDSIRAFGLVSLYTPLVFDKVTESDTTNAYIRLANSSTPPTAHAFVPGVSPTSGDVFFGGTGRDPAMGNFDSGSTVLHEIGHALGLDHGHENTTFGLMTADRRDVEFSLMNYPSYIGSPYAASTTDFSPQTYMMYDIAALQYMYGARFAAIGQDNTYAWSPTTGAMSINGVVQGAPFINKIFQTIWTGGGTTTYDLSAYSENQVDDMTPGGWMRFSSAQLALLNASAAAKPSGDIFARANVYNALLHNGDTRSLIHNIVTGAGNDTITGNSADNVINGGSGTDTIKAGAGNDKLIGGPHGDALDGEAGFDFADYSMAAGPVLANLLAPAGNVGDATGDTYSSVEGLIGTAFGDTLRLGNGGGSTWALGGDDILFGGTANDDLHGQDGNDKLMGDPGADFLDGGAGFDFADYSIAAGPVLANLLAPAGNVGDAAGDTYSSVEGLIGTVFGDTLRLGNGGGSTWALGGDDILFGGAANDDLHGQDGNDKLMGDPGADLLDGGAGFDFADYSIAAGPVLANLLAPAGNVGDAAGDTYSSVEGLIGTAFGDTLRLGNGGGSTWALGGDDILFGGAANDDLHGQDGNDKLMGDPGADLLDGGAGFDFADYSILAAGILASILNPSSNNGDAAGDTYSSVEGLIGSTAADNLQLGNTAGSIWALAGNDGLTGGSGSDDLHGQDGNDVLDGRAGADILEGGPGTDMFVFTRGQANGDTVLDFAGFIVGGGEKLQFQDYGTSGATFTMVDTQWRITSSDGAVMEVLTFSNNVSFQASDYLFV